MIATEDPARPGLYIADPAALPVTIARGLQMTIRRGGSRTGLGLKIDVGLLTFSLLNSEDPIDGGSIQPGHQIRAVSVDAADELRELFTGRVVDIASTYPLNKATGEQRADVSVTVADAVKTHVETPRYGVSIVGDFETFEARIARLEESALAAVDAPTVGAPRTVYAL